MTRYTPDVQAGLDRMREMAKGNFDLSWMNSNPEGWGHRAEPGPLGLRMVDIETGHYGAVPERAHFLSSDPAGVRARLNRCEYTRRHAPDSEELLGYLVGVLIRLDRSEDYDEFVERVIGVGDAAVPALREVVEQTSAGEIHRQGIRDGAVRALRAVMVDG